MAAPHSGAGGAAGGVHRAGRVGGTAGPLVAVRRGHRRSCRGMDAAPPPGSALMGLWKQIARLFGGGAVDYGKLEAVQRLLVEADFGVAATNETVERLSKAKNIDQ